MPISKAKAKKKTSTTTSAPPRDPEKLLKFVETLKKQWMDTIDALVDPLILVNRNYEIIRANRAMASLAGSTVQEVVGGICYKVFAKRKSPCPHCRMLDAKTGSSTPYELYNEAREKHYEVSSQALPDAQVVQIYRDRTEAKRLLGQLLQNEKLASIGLLAGGFAHEINNPVGGILVFSQMLLREMPPTNPHYKDVQEIESAAQRCKEIVNNLLAFARQKPMNAPLEKINLHDPLNSALRFAQVGYNRQRCEIVSHLEAAKLESFSDGNRLTQVFLNLLKNALQAMPKGGTLTIKTSNETRGKQAGWRVDISDTGVGIDPKNLKNIFDPFYTTKQPGEGTGLGLSICHGILQDLGGDITVTSRVKKGSTFSVWLPLA